MKKIYEQLLISSLLSNSESWYNLSVKDVTRLEAVDEALLRKIFSAHSKTPKELLYLESGNIPVRFILMTRRRSSKINAGKSYASLTDEAGCTFVVCG